MDIPDDVLWHIFSQNVHPPPSLSSQISWHRDWPGWRYRQCMRTAKSTSQVCHRWRRVMLSSADIWSKVIDFNTISSFREPVLWLKTVLARAGPTRTFYVSGSVRTHRALRAFLELVRVVWDRMEVINVELVPQDHTAEALVDHVGWVKLTDEVSPSLRYFNLVGSYNLQEEQPRTFNLKSKGPYLLYLRFEGMLQYAYEPQPPRFEALRVLSFENTLQTYHSSYIMDDTRYEWTVDQFFDILDCAPRLEILSLGDHFLWANDPFDYKDRPRLHLPHLLGLNIHCDISACLAILYHVEVRQTCALSMGVDIVDYDVWPLEEVIAVQEILWSGYVRERTFGDFVEFGFEEFCPSITWRCASRSTNSQLHLYFNTSGPDGSDSSTFFPFFDFLLDDAFDFSSVKTLKLDFQHTKDLDRTALHTLMNKFEKTRFLEIDLKYVDFLIPTTLTSADDATTPLSSGLGGVPEILPQLEEAKIFDITPNFVDHDSDLWLRNTVAFCKLYTKRDSGLTDSSVKLCNLKHLDVCDLHFEEEINSILPLLDEMEGLAVSFSDGDSCHNRTRRSEVCGFGRLKNIKVKGSHLTRKWSFRLD